MGDRKWLFIGLPALLAVSVATALFFIVGKDEPDANGTESVADVTGAYGNGQLESTEAFRAAADNMLQLESLAYSYDHNAEHSYVLPAGLSRYGGNASVGGVTEVKYEFKAQHLDNPEKRIVWQSVRLDISATAVEYQEITSFVLELETLHHQDQIYVRLVDMTPSEQVVPSVGNRAIDQLRGKWLRFTNGVVLGWPEFLSEDYKRLEGTEVGRLLEFLHRELNGSYRGDAVFAFLNMLGTISYADSPLAFGYLEDPTARRRISGSLFRFSETDSEAPKPFVFDDCIRDSDKLITCQMSSMQDFVEEETRRESYMEIFELIQLSDVFPIPSRHLWAEALIDYDSIVSQRGALTIDAERNLPLSFTSESVVSGDRQVGGELIQVDGTNSQTTSYEIFNQDLRLSLPEKVTHLSELSVD